MSSILLPKQTSLGPSENATIDGMGLCLLHLVAQGQWRLVNRLSQPRHGGHVGPLDMMNRFRFSGQVGGLIMLPYG